MRRVTKKKPNLANPTKKPKRTMTVQSADAASNRETGVKFSAWLRSLAGIRKT
jgi:hypothetical protein